MAARLPCAAALTSDDSGIDGAACSAQIFCFVGIRGGAHFTCALLPADPAHRVGVFSDRVGSSVDLDQQ